MIAQTGSDPVNGKAVWAASKSLWISGMTVVALVGAPVTFSLEALAVFVALTALTICVGHSVGMHRLLIHRSFEAPLWLEHILVYLGVLVGMAGPFGMIYAHDIRDWAQRQPACHDLFAHRRPFFQDAFWQMHCVLALDHPPRFVIEDRVAQDRFYRFLEATWMLQQAPLALLLFVFGGISWVVWGVAVRVSVSLTGHWLVGHFAHRDGEQGWRVDGVAVQGYNLPRFGLVTFGESYHGNHHAFPESARLGIEPGQVDLGWWFIRLLARLGLASTIKLPSNTQRRAGLVRVAPETVHGARTDSAPNPLPAGGERVRGCR
ncbi:acyl-CoA desaturase [Ensifer sp. LBL]|uniref:acyl-CoA desaturase n=1 Tax=Ensifer sp. LBL TaxID=2991056 RepID=UPI003D22C112